MENSSVSMPYIGLPPFLQDKITIKFQKVKVSMPYIGLPPFLQAADDIHDASEGSVNALYRASPISTIIRFNELADIMIVCQCPISGFPHFYQRFKLLPPDTFIVSMPYIGLPPFLQPTPDPEPTPDPDVSMPYIGLPPFLPSNIETDDEQLDEMCQCPISGFPHFYSIPSKTL